MEVLKKMLKLKLQFSAHQINSQKTHTYKQQGSSEI